MMRKLLGTSFGYLLAGLAADLREFTKFQGFDGRTTLSFLMCTVLGMVVFLVVLMLDRLFQITQSKRSGVLWDL